MVRLTHPTRNTENIIGASIQSSLLQSNDGPTSLVSIKMAQLWQLGLEGRVYYLRGLILRIAPVDWILVKMTDLSEVPASYISGL